MSAFGTLREWPWLALMLLAVAPWLQLGGGGGADTEQVTVTECVCPASFVETTTTAWPVPSFVNCTAVMVTRWS